MSEKLMPHLPVDSWGLAVPKISSVNGVLAKDAAISHIVYPHLQPWSTGERIKPATNGTGHHVTNSRRKVAVNRNRLRQTLADV